MFFEGRTIFLSRSAPRHYLPEWHDICHAVVGRDHLDEPNYGLEGFSEDVSDQMEIDAQSVQFFLLSRFHPDPKKVNRCYRSFAFKGECFHQACERGHSLLIQWLPEIHVTDQILEDRGHILSKS